MDNFQFDLHQKDIRNFVMNFQLMILTIILCIVSADAANILAMVPFQGRSHFIVIQPFLEGLARKGHNVTVVSAFPQQIPIPNYHDVDLSNELKPQLSMTTIDFINDNLRTPLQSMHFIWEMSRKLCQSAYKSSKVQNLINTDQKYDLVITEIFGTDCFVPFAYKWQIPLVSICTFNSLPWMNHRVSNPDNPSYIPNYALPFTDEMVFHERVLNSLALLYAKFGYYYWSDGPSYEISKTYFGTDLPLLSEIYRNTSLILVNNHHSISQVRPLAPNVIEVGGIHLRTPSPLPQDLQQILDESDNGVIVFSFGSVVRTSSLPQKLINAFINAFSRIELTVLWKYEKTIQNLPKNIIVRKWIPQMDVMAHPNVKLLITHGGLASIIEAVFHGVPIIGIPMFSDQPGNILNIVKRGAALQIDYSEIDAEKVYGTIQKILLDPKYKENSEKISRIFRDREQPPLETAIYWTEYVQRHNGAKHLKSSAEYLSWVQLYCLDVLAFLLALVIILFLVASAFIKSILKYLTNKSIAIGNLTQSKYKNKSE